MTTEPNPPLNLEALFEEFEDEHSDFGCVDKPLAARPDLCAFLLLERLLPGDGARIVDAAEHDEIWLDVDTDELARVATRDDILTLVRCGVRLDDGHLSMFV